jgi:hypothetical protein
MSGHYIDRRKRERERERGRGRRVKGLTNEDVSMFKVVLA